MINFLSLGLAAVWVVTIIYLWRAQKEILYLRECCKEKENDLLSPEKNDKHIDLSLGTSSIHDRVIEMHTFGKSIETIAQKLKIPESQVEMTLKFEKIKHNGSL